MPTALFQHGTGRFVACIAALLALASCGAPPTAVADDCLWTNLPPDTRAALFASYDAQGSEGLASVSIEDAEIKQLYSACAPSRAPPSTAQLRTTGIATAGLALQESAARHLAQADDVPEARLFAAWRAVPPKERQLVLESIRSTSEGRTPATDVSIVLGKAARLAGWRADGNGVDPPEVRQRHYLNFFQGLAQSEAFKGRI